MPLLRLSVLHPDPKNANVCDAKTMLALKEHIQRTGFCPSLIVRPHPEIPNEYMIIDGHHRKEVIEELGWHEVECQIKELNEAEVHLLLLTLNRLRGTDIPRKRAELIDSLTPQFSVSELSKLLPESTGEIEGLLALLDQENKDLESKLKQMVEAEAKTLPVPFGFLIPADDVETVKRALAQFNQSADLNMAFINICHTVLKSEGI